MYLRIVLLTLLIFPIALLAQETEIENEYNGYLEDFMVFDFEGIASHFTTPAMFICASTQVMQDENAIKNFYRALKANIQSGYAYSKSSLEINQVTDKIYCLRTHLPDPTVRPRFWSRVLLIIYLRKPNPAVNYF